jgi:hypothetical protein
VIKQSEFITVVLISSGEEAITGTPFDDKINELYKTWKVDQEKTKMPFITALRGKRGTITGYTAVPAPWQVEIPPWPADPVAKAAETNPSASQPSTVASLIVTGKKPKPVETNDSSVTAATTAPSDSAATAQSTPTLPPAKPPVAEPAHSSPAPETGSPQQKVEHSTESPQHPAPAVTTPPRDATRSISNANPAITTASLANSSNAITAVPIKTAQQSKSPPQDISTAIATPSSLLSSKLIWFAGLAVLGVACVLLMTLTRRPQSEPISLITRSLERESK